MNDIKIVVEQMLKKPWIKLPPLMRAEIEFTYEMTRKIDPDLAVSIDTIASILSRYRGEF